MDNCHILKINKRDIGNGPGIRVSVWVAGCSHQCKGCHNSETWKWNQGTSLSKSIVNNILNACDKPYIKGLTLTGGDPLFLKNREGILQLCKAFKKRFNTSKDIWMWTGYKYDNIKDLEVLNYIDVLIDDKFIESLKDVSLPYAGSKNQNVIYLKDKNA